MAINLPNILPINVVGTISGTEAAGTPTSIFSLATVQNVVIVNEDPLEVNLVGGSDIVSVSGHLQSEIDAVEASDVDALTVSGGSDIAGTIDFVGSNGINISDSGNTITVDGSGIIDAVGLQNIVEDTDPNLGGDLDAENFDIVGIHELTAATGTFTTSLAAPTGTFANTLIALNLLTAVTGTFFDGLGTGGNLTVGGNTLLNQLTASTGIFSQSLTVSGVSVNIAGPTTNHAALNNLDFASAGHTGFGSSADTSALAASGVATDANVTVNAADIAALTTSGDAHISSVVEDTTPELGGNLDALTRDITNVTALTSVTGTFTDGLTIGTGSVSITTSGINFSSLPTDPGFLNSGDIWVDTVADFVLKIVP